MAWQGILGHDAVVDRLRRSIQMGRLPSTYLFVGPVGIGKRAFANKFAQALLCESSAADQLDPCGTCAACQQVMANSHPDFEVVAKPADKSFIPVELFIGDREHRMREGLCHRIALKPYRGGRKVAIIDDADYLNQEGANCLLKTLEEPPPRSVLILISSSEQRQLPTIRSRCQVVRFQPLDSESLVQLILDEGIAADRAAAERLAGLSHGSLEQARHWADETLAEFYGELLRQLASPAFQPAELARQTGSFVDQAGKDAPARRLRLKQTIERVADFYRQSMLFHSGAGSVVTAAETDVPDWLTAEAAADRLDRCLTAITQLDSNANQATLLDAWFDDLAPK